MDKNKTSHNETLVLFVRHGKTPTTGKVLPGRTAGLNLSQTGIDQATAAAERIAQLDKVAAVYASPMERTLQTAEPIAQSQDLEVEIESGLIECDFGDWTGAKLKDLRKKPEWETVLRHPSGFRFPGGESFSEMQNRATGTISELVAKHANETIVAVSHADIIKALVACATGTHLDLFQRIVISPCSISAVLYNPSGPIVLTINSTGDDLRSLLPS